MLKRDEEIWKSITDEVGRKFDIDAAKLRDLFSSGEVLKQKLPERLAALDDAPAMEATAATDKMRAGFSPFHVEALLNQASDLLDRAIRDRAEWNELRVRAASEWLQILEFVLVDFVHRAEQEAGAYELPYTQAVSAAEAERLARSSHLKVRELVSTRNVRQHSPQAMAEDVVLRQYSAWAQVAPAHEVKDAKPNKLEAVPMPVQRARSWLDPQPELAADKKSKAAMNMRYEREMAARSLEGLAAEAEIEAERARLDAVRSEARLSGLESEESWQSVNRGFRETRAQIARDVMDLRIREFADPRGAFNYIDRMAPIKERFQDDFKEARARLQVAEEGLLLVYGYDDPFPPPSIDNYVNWARRAINFVVRVTQREQVAITPLSLAELLPQSVWEDGRRKGEWSVPVVADMLPHGELHRVRGISAYVETRDASHSIWRVDVRPPAPSNPVEMRTADGEVRTMIVSQRHLPLITCGRSGRRETSRSPDVLGVSALHNVNPIGTWVVRVGSKAANSPITREQVSDVQLDIHVAVRL